MVVFASGTHLDLMDGDAVFLSHSLSSVMITACAVRRSWGSCTWLLVGSVSALRLTAKTQRAARLQNSLKGEKRAYETVLCVTLPVVFCRSSSKGEWSHAGGHESVCVTGYCTCSVGLWLVRLDSHTRSAALTLHITCFYIYVVFVLDTVWCHQLWFHIWLARALRTLIHTKLFLKPCFTSFLTAVDKYKVYYGGVFFIPLQQ